MKSGFTEAAVDALRSRLAEHVRTLAGEIGPRGPASEGERKAAAYIENFFRSLGLEVTVESFRSLKTFSWVHAGAYLCSSAAVVWLLRWQPYLASVLAVASWLGFFLETLSIPALGWMATKGRSQNVVAKLDYQDPREAPVKLCVVAHYDTSRAGPPFHPRMVRNFRATSLLVLAAMFASALLCTAAALVPRFKDTAVVLGLAPGAYTAFAASLLILRELIYPQVPGANDNASGVAVLLESARILAAERTPGLEVTFLATGCEEAGVVGMLNFLKRHGREYRDAYFVNLDNLGAGFLKYTAAEGMYTLWQSDPLLVELAAEVVRSDPSLKASPCEYRTLLTDGQAAMMRGYRAMGIMAFDEHGVLPNWHWITDVPENVNPENLVGATKLVVGIARSLPARVAATLPK